MPFHFHLTDQISFYSVFLFYSPHAKTNLTKSQESNNSQNSIQNPNSPIHPDQPKMQSIPLNSPSFLSIPHPNSSRPSLCRRKTSIPAWKREAADQNFGGRIVDENMIVLRKRIHEMKMIEKNYEPPSDWMDWEKQYYTTYDSMICEALGILQTQLMNTRPSLALGIIALIAMSVPASSAFLLFHLVDLCKQVLEGIHL